MKVCYVASSGGHWEELMCLAPIMDRHASFLVTEAGGQANESRRQVYKLPQTNRKEIWFVLKFFWLFIRAAAILLKEKPDVIVTTGALIAFPFCLLGKMAGKKVVYIESFARVEGRSLTGRLVYPFADLFVVQWPEMVKVYPKAVCGGGIF